MIESYHLPKKGGRTPTCGPNSIKKYCDLNYTKRIGSVRAERIRFNVDTIRDIMKDRKNQHPSNI